MDKKGQAKRRSTSLAKQINESIKENRSQAPRSAGPPPLPTEPKTGQPIKASLPQTNLDGTTKASRATMPPPIPELAQSPKPAPMRRSGQPPVKQQSSKVGKSESTVNLKEPGQAEQKAQEFATDRSEVPIGVQPKAQPAPTNPIDNGNQGQGPKRRAAQRRPAGPSRERIAANDDAPSIGGLIYALNQRPSKKPFMYAIGASVIWAIISIVFAWAFMSGSINASEGFSSIVTHPTFLTALATVLGPIILFWFLAFLMWRTEELHLRSSAMTEVAVRLAEPDRMAEQSVASLGQAIRRQVSFMNDAVTRALGRAGELEALVHNEVSALEQSYEDNERKIRALIRELASERHALQNTGDGFKGTLLQLGAEVPQLIENLSHQQLKLAQIIEYAGTNLTQLETAIGGKTDKLQTSLGENTNKLQLVLEDYTTALAVALDSRTQQIHGLLEDNRQTIDNSIEKAGLSFGASAKQIEAQLGDATKQLENRLEQSAQNIDGTLNNTVQNISQTLTDRTETMQVVFEEYARALDTTLSNRTNMFDMQLVERTKALDEAFGERLKLFDEAIMRSALSIDQAVGENTRSLTSALEQHAESFNETLGQQSAQLDETLVRGIETVRASSENISRQSIKAIEGLAGQSDMLRNISENVLSQISNVSNRFENQSNAITRSANALESANYRIDKMLSDRSSEVNMTLERMSERAEEIGNAFSTYTQNLDGSMEQAHERAKLFTQDLARQTEEQTKATVDNFERLKAEVTRSAGIALEDLRGEFSSVSNEIKARLGSMSDQFSQATNEVRQRASHAAQQLENEQGRLKEQLDQMPHATQESAAAMRKALQDQLKALDQLAELANRTTNQASIAPTNSEPTFQLQDETSPIQQQVPPEADRPLTTLTNTLAREMNERSQVRSNQGHPTINQQHHADATLAGLRTFQRPHLQQQPLNPVSSATQGTSKSTHHQEGVKAGDAQWSFGELLSRMPEDEQDQGNIVMQSPEEPTSDYQQATVHAQSNDDNMSAALDVASISRALEPSTAAAIWSRFRSGQRGFMVRSIYAPEARQLFDEIVHRYQSQMTFRTNVDRFVHEFEQILRESDQSDPSGELTQSQIVTDAGRVYLLLSHASQRLF